MISQRHLSRIAAMQSIFSLLHKPQSDFLSEIQYISNELPEKLKSYDFSLELTEGAFAFREKTEELIKASTRDNDLEKIDPLTLSILLLAVFELQFSPNKQPAAVVINEAVELAKEFGKETAPSLVNALLSKIKDS